MFCGSHGDGTALGGRRTGPWCWSSPRGEEEGPGGRVYICSPAGSRRTVEPVDNNNFFLNGLLQGVYKVPLHFLKI